MVKWQICFGFLSLLNLFVENEAFQFGLRMFRPIVRCHKTCCSPNDSSDSEVDGKELEGILNSIPPLNEFKIDSHAVTSLRQHQEEVYRKFPFAHHGLPLLPDCDGYFSGSCNGVFWHQDSDEVLVQIPVGDNTSKNCVHAKFSALHVDVDIDDLEPISFECVERIIPDGSFWTLETGKDNKKFVQLNLEKRFVR
jgi:hypothetical protein